MSRGSTRAAARPATSRHTLDYQLREIIDSRGLTAYAVAQRADLDPGIVSRWMTGARGMSFESADKIALALGLRLVETARGRSRPVRTTKAARPPGDAGESAGVRPGSEADGPESWDEIEVPSGG